MCELCMAKTEYIGEFVPGWHLSIATKEYDCIKVGDYCLTRANHPDFVIPAKLKIIPNPMLKYDNEEQIKYKSLITEIEYYLMGELQACYALVMACKKAGWKRSKDLLEPWLIERLAQTIKEFEENKNV